jgi:hypothetical protein
MDPTHGVMDHAHGLAHGPCHGPGGAACRSMTGRQFEVGIWGRMLGEMNTSPRGSPQGGLLAVRWSRRQRSMTVAER